MSRRKRTPNLIAFIAIGAALIAVGISTDNRGFMGAGVLFIIVGAASIIKAKRKRDTGDTRDEQQQD
jgi:hypothetical protein